MEEGQRALEAYRELVRLMGGGKNKSTSADPVPSETSPFKAGFTAEVDTAKVAKNLELLIEKPKKYTKEQKKGFIEDLAKVLRTRRYSSKIKPRPRDEDRAFSVYSRDVKTGLITTRRIIFTPSVDLRNVLADTSIQITCLDEDGTVLKRVTSDDDGTVEDNEEDGDNQGGQSNQGTQNNQSNPENPSDPGDDPDNGME